MLMFVLLPKSYVVSNFVLMYRISFYKQI